MLMACHTDVKILESFDIRHCQYQDEKNWMSLNWILFKISANTITETNGKFYFHKALPWNDVNEQ